MRKHLAVLTKGAIKAIFNGEKTVEIRLSEKKIAPFSQVHVGDLVYMKPPGEEIEGQFEIKRVASFEGLTDKEWKIIRREYSGTVWLGSVKLTQEFFEKHKSAQFATIIHIGQVEHFIASPVKIAKKDLRGWVVLS
jgi:predicted transcriptional regulator